MGFCFEKRCKFRVFRAKVYDRLRSADTQRRWSDCNIVIFLIAILKLIKTLALLFSCVLRPIDSAAGQITDAVAWIFRMNITSILQLSITRPYVPYGIDAGSSLAQCQYVHVHGFSLGNSHDENYKGHYNYYENVKW